MLKKNGTPKEFVHSIVTTFMILFYIFFMIFVIIFGIGLFYLDLKQIYNYINDNNDYFTVIKENLLGSDKLRNYQQTVFEQLNSIEVYLNNTYIKIDSQLTNSTFLQGGNYTIYGTFLLIIDLSNKLIGIINDPLLVVEGIVSPHLDREDMYKYHCEKYENAYISIVQKIFQSDYVTKFHCSSRILLQQLNIDVPINRFR
jgi:hypothetical protein